MPVKAVWHEHEGDYPRLHWQLDEKAFAAFGKYGVVEELTKGEVVFEQGEPSDSLYVVLEGGIAVSRDGQELGVVAANHSFGEMGLLLDLPRTAKARAMMDSRVLQMSRADLDRMILEEPLWAARLFKVLAECLAEYLHRSSTARPSLPARFRKPRP